MIQSPRRWLQDMPGRTSHTSRPTSKLIQQIVLGHSLTYVIIRNMGPMHPEWHERMEPHCFGVDDSIGDLSWDEEECPLYVDCIFTRRDLSNRLDHRPKRVRSQAEKQKRLRQKQAFRRDRSIAPHKQKEISKWMEKRVSSARVNYTIFDDFDYSKALQYRHNSVPAEPTSWSGGIARSAVSGDGVNLAFYLPNTFTQDWTTSTTQWLVDFGTHRMKPHFKEAGSSEADYVHRAGELSGGIAPVRGWHAIGSEVVRCISLCD